jgi:pyruvate dehydrogenase E1 component
LPYDLGGHIASFASSATLYEVGFNHFYRGPDAEQGADLIFFFCNSVLPLYIHEDKCELQGQVQQDKIKQ